VLGHYGVDGRPVLCRQLVAVADRWVAREPQLEVVLAFRHAYAVPVDVLAYCHRAGYQVTAGERRRLLGGVVGRLRLAGDSCLEAEGLFERAQSAIGAPGRERGAVPSAAAATGHFGLESRQFIWSVEVAGVLLWLGGGVPDVASPDRLVEHDLADSTGF